LLRRGVLECPDGFNAEGGAKTFEWISGGKTEAAFDDETEDTEAVELGLVEHPGDE
jgi:hypothetical protein